MAHACKIELWLTWTGACDQYNIVRVDTESHEVTVDVVPLAPSCDAHAALERASQDILARYGFEVPLFL